MVRIRPKKPLIALMTLLALSGTAAMAHAGVLASGYLISSNAVRMGCRVLNVGSLPVKILSAEILLGSGYTNTDYDSCTGTLAPGKSCSISGLGQDLAGIVKADGGTARLRGTCMLLTAGNNILGSTEMR